MALFGFFFLYSAVAEGSLKEAFQGDFLVGAALNDSHFAMPNPVKENLVAGQFNSITPENVLKWDAIHPELDRYDFAPADRYVDFGDKHGMFVVGHALVWHQQLPSWVLNDNGKPVSREVALERMRDHIHVVVGRYKGRIHAWDVVNEALNEDGSLRSSPWLQIIGEDYIEKAFAFAHEADPEAELYYNDYSLENEPKRKGAIALVKSLQAAGLRIDGVGIQGHSRLRWPRLEELDATLTEIGDLGLKTMITELDIDVLPGKNNNGSAEISLRGKADPSLDPYTEGLPPEMQEKLAQRYADFFSVYLKHRDTLERVTFWGVSDRGSWLNGWPIPDRTNHPLLFDRQGEAKPAYAAVLEVGGMEAPAAKVLNGNAVGEPLDQAQPNIVIFIADDLAWHDVVCFGGPTDARTPNIDQLATEGMKLTGFYSSSSVCSPTRQALLTGMYPVRSGAYPNHSMVRPGTKSLPYYLKPLGYRTLGAGKKHFAPAESYPFEVWLPMVGEDKAKKIDGDIDFKGLEKFITAEPNRPFFAYLATHEPHGRWTKGDQSAYLPEEFENIPPYLIDTPGLRKALMEYYAEVSLCDDQVGQVMEILKRTGQDRNTIFLFFSEQGSSMPQGKWSLYNSGIRVAAIATWPDHIAPESSNGALVQYVDIAPTLIAAAGGDPTQANTGIPDSVGHHGFDGHSILDVLLSKTERHRDFIFAQHTTRGIINGSEAYGTRAVSDGRWKLLLNLEPENEFTNVISDGWLIRSWRKEAERGNEFAARQAERYGRRPEIELYHLESDPWELVNVAEQPGNAQTVVRLQTELAGWMKQQGDRGHQTEMEALNHQPRRYHKKKVKQSKPNPAAAARETKPKAQSILAHKNP